MYMIFFKISKYLNLRPISKSYNLCLIYVLHIYELEPWKLWWIYNSRSIIKFASFSWAPNTMQWAILNSIDIFYLNICPLQVSNFSNRNIIRSGHRALLQHYLSPDFPNAHNHVLLLFSTKAFPLLLLSMPRTWLCNIYFFEPITSL